MTNKKKFRHLSLFSGCGGMDIGINGNFNVIEKFINGKNSSKWINVPETKFKTVFANDIKLDAYKFWKKNLLDEETVFEIGSIVDLVKKHKKNKNIFPKDIDLVTGGFPCQDFSVSGLRGGFNSHKSHLNDRDIKKKKETRGMLYLWMKEVIELTEPKVFIAENVKGLVNMKNVFDVIKSDFSKTGPGYEVYSRELFAPDYGIPQSRRRIFFIGINKNFIKKKNIKVKEDDLFPDIEFTSNPDMFIKNKFPKAKLFFKGLKEPSKEMKDFSQIHYSKAKYSPGNQGQIEVNEEGIAPTIRSEHHGNIEFRYLSKKNGGKNVGSNKQRRLTVRECARIQTFPDNLEFVFDERTKDSLSASASYKLIGDAVPPLLAYKIASKIEKFLSKFS